MIRWINTIHPDDRERAAETIEQAKLTGSYWDELRVVRPGTTPKWVELVAAVEVASRRCCQSRTGGRNCRSKGNFNQVDD